MPRLYGYDVPNGYMGYVEKEGVYILFSSYRDYVEYVSEQ